MSYKFILGSNPQHEPGKRKQYIVCLEPHTAVIQVEKADYTFMVGGKFIDDYVHRKQAYKLTIKKMHTKYSEHGNGDTYQPFDVKSIEGCILRNAWHWYKSVLDKQN